MLIIFIRQLHPCWLWENLLDFLKGLFYTITDLNLQICQGALSMAKDCLEMLIDYSLNETGRQAILECAANEEERSQLTATYEVRVNVAGNPCLLIRDGRNSWPPSANMSSISC